MTVGGVSPYPPLPNDKLGLTRAALVATFRSVNSADRSFALLRPARRTPGFHRGKASTATLALLLAVSPIACSQPSGPSTESVSSAWQRRNANHSEPALTYRDRSAPPAGALPASEPSADPPIATVNGTAIPRGRLIELLIRSRGVAVLDQLVGLETARQSAELRGASLTEADVAREETLSLRRLVDPLWSVAPQTFDRRIAEQVLTATLSQRNMSREEFDILTRRNAYLRKLAEADILITDADLQSEFAVQFGPKVEVRHIQLTAPHEAARLRERIAQGEDFTQLASQYSANTASGSEGGLLAPFSLQDERLPEAFRSAIAPLRPGDVSGVVRVGPWHHVIRLEKLLPAAAVSIADVRTQLEETLRDRLAEQRMFRDFERLFREADIVIHDPVLASQFEEAHGDLPP